jgi:hypothetical protein
MDHEILVHRAAAGDVRAFVELTRRFQHLAFGSAVAFRNAQLDFDRQAMNRRDAQPSPQAQY